jgi:hypothetical protein
MSRDSCDYKEGRGDYYLAAGLRESGEAPLRRTITKRQLTRALSDTGIAPIGMSYETAAGQIWMALGEQRK